MEELQFKLPRREKAALIWRFLRPVVGFFIAALLFACLSNAFHAMTPQIIKVTVDSILGNAAPAEGDWFSSLLPLEALMLVVVSGVVLQAQFSSRRAA